MSPILRSLSVLVLAIAFASCGAGQPGASLVPDAPQVHSLHSSAKRAALRVTLPAIAPIGAPIDWASKPNLLSPATRSVSGSIGTWKFGPVALAAPHGNCGSTSGGLTCSILLHAPVGVDQALTLSTYATAAGTGPALAASSATVSVYGGESNFIAPPVYGLAYEVAARPLNDTVRQGTWSAEPIVVYGIDAAKQPIPSSNLRNARGSAVVTTVPIALSGFATRTLADSDGTPYPCCGIVAPVFAYDGRHAGIETFTAKAPGFPAHSATLKVLPGSSALGMLVIGDSYSDEPNYVNFVALFAGSGNGNVAPLRSFIPPDDRALPFGEDMKGNFWVGAAHLSNKGDVIESLGVTPNQTPMARDAAGNVYAFGTTGGNCAAFEFAASHLSGSPVREIDFPCSGSPTDLVADRDGTVFVALPSSGPTQPAKIMRFDAHSGSGAIAPSLTIVAPPSSTYAAFASIDLDGASNLYALYTAGATPRLLKFAPGSTSGQQILPGVAVQSFAVDDAGGIYARVYTAPGPGSLDYFPRGATRPARVITGSKTQLYDVGAVVVPRS